jgi:glycosyltransferase involved in cell wall biosynthesis
MEAQEISMLPSRKNNMKVTAILCTYNRCQKLAKAMESLAASVFPDSDEWEVLVVDNNSRDETRAVVDGFVHRYPGHFRYIFEAKQGKSHALNTGIRESRGEILAFVDDDVTVEPDWLYNLTKVLRDDAWAGTGGRILPDRDVTLPPWLAFDGQWGMGAMIVAHFDFGNKPCQLKEPPYGTNMAFRKEIFTKYGLFRTDLGPRPGSEIRNEDTEFGRRLLAAGERLLYLPSAVVYHEVPEHRATKKFLLRRSFDNGRAEIRERKTGPRVWGISRRYFRVVNYILRFLPRTIRRWLRARDPQQRFYFKCVVWHSFGELVEMWRQPSAPAENSKAPGANAVLD